MLAQKTSWNSPSRSSRPQCTVSAALASGFLTWLRSFDLNPDHRPAPARLRPASVLVPLIERGPALNLILTRRAALLKHHPGQVAFPGGKQDPDDATPLAAALREAREEIGLDGADVLGQLDLHETVTGFAVSLFVGLAAASGLEPKTAMTAVVKAAAVRILKMDMGGSLPPVVWPVTRPG